MESETKNVPHWFPVRGVIPVSATMYTFMSISLTFYQKAVMLHHPFPGFVVMSHYILKFIYCSIARQIASFVTGKRRTVLSWSLMVQSVLFVGVFSAIDICLSQWSMELVSVSVYTLVKTSSIIWIFVFGVAYGLESCNRYSIFTAVAIFTGLIILSLSRHGISNSNSTSSSYFGVILVLVAAISSGLRWATAQISMQKKELGLSNPIDFMFHVQPIMIATLISFVIYLEGTALVTSKEVFNFYDTQQLYHFMSVIVMGSLLAFFMEVCEFLLVSISSSMTLVIVSAFKEVLTILIDILYHQVHLSTQYIIGMCVVLFGVVMHTRHKLMMVTSSEANNQSSSSIISSESDENSSNVSKFSLLSGRRMKQRPSSSSRHYEQIGPNEGYHDSEETDEDDHDTDEHQQHQQTLPMLSAYSSEDENKPSA